MVAFVWVCQRNHVPCCALMDVTIIASSRCYDLGRSTGQSFVNRVLIAQAYLAGSILTVHLCSFGIRAASRLRTFNTSHMRPVFVMTVRLSKYTQASPLSPSSSGPLLSRMLYTRLLLLVSRLLVCAAPHTAAWLRLLVSFLASRPDSLLTWEPYPVVCNN